MHLYYIFKSKKRNENIASVAPACLCFSGATSRRSRNISVLSLAGMCKITGRKKRKKVVGLRIIQDSLCRISHVHPSRTL